MKKVLIFVFLFALPASHLKATLGIIPSMGATFIALWVPAICTGIYCPTHMGVRFVKRTVLFDTVFFSTALALNALFGVKHNQPGNSTCKKWFDSAIDACVLTVVSRFVGECVVYFTTKLGETLHAKDEAYWRGQSAGHCGIFLGSFMACVFSSKNWSDFEDDDYHCPLCAVGSVIPPLTASLALICCKNVGII